MEQGYSVNQSLKPGLPEFYVKLGRSLYAHFLFLFLLVLGLYIHTLNAPFYLDDIRFITENPYIQGLGSFDSLGIQDKLRFITLLSFHADYQIHELNVAGYHIVNILIHFLTAVSVYFLTFVILKTQLAGSSLRDDRKFFVPLLTAILFAVHPLQIQAVTYITQRAASLTAFFYLSSMTCYLLGRLHYKNMPYLFFGLCFILGVCALLTKQNSFSLPAALLFAEFILFKHRFRFILIPITAVILLSLLLYFMDLEFLVYLGGLTTETTTVSRVEYFLIQLKVVWIYLFKFVFPVNLHLDYNITTEASYLTWKYILSGTALVFLIGTAFKLRKRSPILSFSLLFYFIALSVESSFIPIRDFAFEHRTYLPNFGLCLFVSWVSLAVIQGPVAQKTATMILPVIIIGLAALTWIRNDQWNDPVRFYENEITLEPENLRSYNLLAEYYISQNDFQDAKLTYARGVNIAPTSFDRGNNTVPAFYLNFIISLDATGQSQDALKIYDILDLSGLAPPMKSRYLTVKANINYNSGNFVAAEPDYIEAISLDNGNIQAKIGYGMLLGNTNRGSRSLALFQEILQQDPDNEEAQTAVEFYRNNPPNSP